MADNYLERRMDDYRSGRLNKPVRTAKHNKSASAAEVQPLTGQRVFIKVPSASASPRAIAMITLLRSAGCRVAFTDSDITAGNRLAQSTGAQCHPVDIADEVAVARSEAALKSHWGDIDITVDFTRECIPQ